VQVEVLPPRQLFLGFTGAFMLALPDDSLELVRFDAGTNAVVSREGKRLEFKQSFEAGDFSEYTKVLASFANAQGGVIVFGISDKPREIVGAAAPIDPTCQCEVRHLSRAI
jgi:hypothetical protein